MIKYANLEHTRSLRDTGQIRIGTLRAYRTTETDQIRDELEGTKPYIIHPDDQTFVLTHEESNEVLSSDSLRLVNGWKLAFPSGGMTRVKPTEGFNTFVYCCCVGEKPDEVQAERFERSSWYRLTDVAEFATRVKILLRDQLKIAQEIVIVRGPVNYVDNKGVIVTPSTRHLITPHEKILPVNLLFEKPVQFAPEPEYRFMWMVMIGPGSDTEPTTYEDLG